MNRKEENGRAFSILKVTRGLPYVDTYIQPAGILSPRVSGNCHFLCEPQECWGFRRLLRFYWNVSKRSEPLALCPRKILWVSGGGRWFGFGFTEISVKALSLGQIERREVFQINLIKP